jgi:hypothetical protein
LNVAAKRWLGHVEELRRLAKTAQIRNVYEVSDLPQFHPSAFAKVSTSSEARLQV